MFWELKGKGNLLKFLSGLILFCNRVPVRPVVNSRAPIEDDLETEAAVLANFDFLQNDVEDEEDNEDDNDDDGGSADDESDDRDDLRLGRRMGKRAKQGVVPLPFSEMQTLRVRAKLALLCHGVISHQLSS